MIKKKLFLTDVSYVVSPPYFGNDNGWHGYQDNHLKLQTRYMV